MKHEGDPDAGVWPLILKQVRCCRTWEIVPCEPIGRCGLCGEVPQ